MSAKCAHKHVQTSEPAGFSYCVAHHPYTDCHPAAHGSVTYTETCMDCGHERSLNANGLHEEVGTWHESPAQREARHESELLASIARDCRGTVLGLVAVVLRTDRASVTVGMLVPHEQRIRTRHVLTWAELRAAANQHDTDLAAQYQCLLSDAERCEHARLTGRKSQGYAGRERV